MSNNVFDLLCKDLRTLGSAEGNTVMVHSSLRSLGPLPNGAETVISALLEVLGKDGTLLFPALSYRTVNAANPVFDVNNSPCCVGENGNSPLAYRLLRGIRFVNSCKVGVVKIDP